MTVLTKMHKACCGIAVLFLLSTPASACTEVKDWLSVCTDGSKWEAVVDKDGEILFRDTDTFKGQLLVYKGGTGDGLEVEDAAASASQSDKKSSEEYEILTRGKMPSGNIVFTSHAKRDGTDYIYVTTLSMGAKETLRITTWQRGTQVTDADRVAHRAFGALIKLKGTR
ncbi:MAG: hypothetical protein ABJN34_00505 [Litoreibacter sp.]|uniref:hypothetical protein n=1 Tax=Litoreibacter sp. TaxID=1969459 RepID=UPI0032978FDE